MALTRTRRSARWLTLLVVILSSLLCWAPAATAQTPAGATAAALKAHFSNQVAMDVSPPLRSLSGRGGDIEEEDADIREEAGPHSAPDSGFSGDAAVQTTVAPAAIPATASQFRGPEQPGQLRPLRLPGEPAGPDRRRRPQPLRRDGQPRRSPSTARPGRRCSGRSTSARSGPASRSTTAPTRQATRSSSTTSWPTAGSCRSSRPAAWTTRRCRSTTASRSRRAATRPGPTTATRSPPGSTSPTTRSTASGPTPT